MREGGVAEVVQEARESNDLKASFDLTSIDAKCFGEGMTVILLDLASYRMVDSVAEMQYAD